ncbi:CASP-like protein 4D1 [Rhodamnia argentea]|uniref:CASP-like protein n=1 Tax=Rhodamnia argentea TaxID=178133 RepID=A0ABM3HQV2_9MYRT|nr:CASP-like protein 4D1 [Rhodamnia argentea]
MANRRVANSMLVFRIFSLLALAGSVALMVANRFTDSNGLKTTFKNINSYRYVLATAVIGAAYIIVQLPFAIYYACTEKRMFRNGCLPEFDFYGDKLITLLLATGIGAGFAISFELKKYVRNFFDVLVSFDIPINDDDKSKSIKFLNWGIISTGLLALGLVCMVIVSVLSSINRNSSTRGSFFR